MITNGRVSLALASLLLAAGVAACSSSAASSGGSSKEQTLTIVDGGAGDYNAAPYLAQVLGFAKKEGLNLTVKNANANVISLVTSGQADLGLNSPGSMFPIARQGMQTEIVWAMERSGASSFAVGAKGVKTLADCKRIATNPVGAASYDALVEYKAALHATYTIVPIGSVTDIAPTVVSGENNCAMAGLAATEPAITAGAAHLLFDPRKQLANPSAHILPAPSILQATGDGLWGLKSHLATKKTALIELMRALNMANHWLKTHTVPQIAEALKKHPDMVAQTVPYIETTYLADQPFLDPNGGLITPAGWKANLELYGVTFAYIKSGTGPYSYSNMVNMSYLEAADK
jgi:ABC-type nitrate/sulfonate/bicarbonate transport system substrate-binding protein